MKIILSVLALLLVPVSNLLAHGLSDADKANMIAGGLFRYIELGARHMVTGYDHLLFLFGVIFFLTKFKEIIRFITAFTLGHSITLIGATFMGINANYFLIDAVIALTVFYKGFDNVDGFKRFLGMKSPNLIKLVFAFGLIHGFGLSTRLQQLPLGEDGLLLRIISFNVGVEIGQIAALSVMILLLAGWRKTASFKRFSVVSNGGLMLAGVLLFFMQMHGYTHDVFVDDLAFSSDSHYHEHVKSSRKGEIPADQWPTQSTSDESSRKEKRTSSGNASPHSHGGASHVHEPKAIPTPVPTVGKSKHSHGSGQPHSH